MRSIIKNPFSKSGIIVLGAILVAGFLVIKPQNPISEVPKAHAATICAGADIMLVLDESGSMSSADINDVKDAAKTFASIAFGEAIQHRIGVIWFEDSARLEQGLTNISSLVNSAIDSGSSGGKTNMTAAINSAGDHFSDDTIESNAEIIILLSDGDPNNEENAKTAAKTFKNEGGILYTIGLGSGVDEDFLKEIATSPSHYSDSPSSADLEDIFEELAEDLPTLDNDGDGFTTATCPAICEAAGGCDADDNNKCIAPRAPEGRCVVSAEACATLWSATSTKAAYEKALEKCADFGNDLCRLYRVNNVTDFNAACEYKENPLGSDTYYAGCNDNVDNNQNGNVDTAELTCPKPGGLTVCGRYADDPTTLGIDESEPCGFCHFFSLFDRIIDWVVLKIAPTIAALLLIIGGLAVATSRGNQAQLTRGKDTIIWTLAGYAVILVGWMLINSFFGGIGVKKWTGLREETAIIKKVYGNMIWTDKTDWSSGQFDGLTLEIIESSNPSLVGEKRTIKRTWDEHEDNPADTFSDCPDGPGDATGLPSATDTHDCLESTTGWPSGAPNEGDKLKIGGDWWQSTCGTE